MKKYFILLSVVLVAACGGGNHSSSGGTEVQGLAIANQMSLVTANETGSSSLSALVPTRIAAVPTSGDYLTDEPTIYVYDQSMESLDVINEILCSIDQLHYADMVNQGPYLALVDKSLCSQREDRSGQDDNQSSGQTQQFETWTVDVAREDNDSPQIVEAWIDQSSQGDHDDPVTEIRARMIITAASSSANPFGEFSINFMGYGENSVQLMEGYLSSSTTTDGQVEFEMSVDGGERSTELTHAIIDPSGDAGQAYAFRRFSMEGFGGGTEEVEYNIAFDSDHYLAEFGGNSKCLDRVNFDENVWEYNLYDADGNRAELNSGFSIQSDFGYGWAGYYGVWLPGGDEHVENGATVTDDDGNDYTVFVGAGRMTKRTRHVIELDDIEGDTLTLWDNNAGQQLQVSWNGTNLMKTGVETCGDHGCSVEPIEPVALAIEPFQWLGLWKQGFGSIDLVVPESGTLTGSMEVPYYEMVFVTPSDAEFADGTVTMHCYFSCPRPNLTQEDMDSGDIFFDDIYDPEDEPYEYTFNPSTYTLSFDGEPIVIDDSIDLATSPYSWGIHSGAMVLADVSVANPWEIWQQATTYNWETGPNMWNKYVSLLDSNAAAVEFDPPLSCLYTSDDDGTFILDYQGEGKLFGIPFEQVSDEDTGFEYWRAAFTIPNGAELNCGGTNYYTKAMTVEQTMQEDDASACNDLSVEGVGAPDNTFEDPEMDAAPIVNAPPAVVGGVLVE